MTKIEIFNAVSAILQQALRVKPDQIRMESRLFLDLGAESIDILDIRFRLERTFGFKIDQNEFKQSMSEELTAEEIQEKFTVGVLVEYVGYRLAQQRTGT